MIASATDRLGNPYIRPRLWAFDYLGLVATRQTLERLLAAHLGARRGIRVLDVGCGAAPWRALFDPFAAEYVGLDLQPGPAVDIVAPADKIPLPDASVDVVFSDSMLEHVRDARAAIAEMHRVLRAGGLVVAAVPFFWEVHGEPHDYRRWTSFGLREEFAAFRDCSVEQIGSPVVSFLLTQNVFLRHVQVKFHAIRWLFSPLLFLNNLTGRLFGMNNRRPTTLPAAYVLVGRK